MSSLNRQALDAKKIAADDCLLIVNEGGIGV
jgi:hypothetical protein